MIKIIPTKLAGCLSIQPEVHIDSRGFFLEIFQAVKYSQIGVNIPFVQDNCSLSSKGVLRGLHFQKTKPQGKLVWVVYGEIFDVVVDLRSTSKTYRNYLSMVLSGKNKKQIWIPPGFAHGFQVLTDSAIIQYKCTDYYDPEDEVSIMWSDPLLNINWPEKNPVLSDKDSAGIYLKDLQK